MINTLRIILATLSVLTLLGCASAPESKRDELPVTVAEDWDARGFSPDSSADAPVAWVSVFGDATLERLVAQALNENYDLKAAAARVDAARSQAVIAGAPQMPTLDATLSASRQKTNLSGSSVTTAAALPGAARRSEPVTSHSQEYNPGLSVSWEVDLWGKLRNRASAAIADAQAAEATWRGVRISIAAQTARAWYRYVEAGMQLQLAEDTARVFDENRTVVEERFERGLVEALDVRLIRNNAASGQALVSARRAERDAALRALKVLLGEYPNDDFDKTGSLPEALPPVDAGLPSTLIERRPDLVAAERVLAAEGERVYAARKDLLPAISLTASGGTRSDDLKDTLDTDYNVWRLASNLVQPIFQGKRLSAALEAQKARSEQALADYASAVLQAFSEVETALAAEAFLTDREGYLREAAEEASAAEELAWKRYQSGLTGIVTLLDAQRRAFDAKSSLLAVQRQRIDNRINLYLALGGEL